MVHSSTELFFFLYIEDIGVRAKGCPAKLDVKQKIRDKVLEQPSGTTPPPPSFTITGVNLIPFSSKVSQTRRAQGLRGKKKKVMPSAGLNLADNRASRS
mmetsp:Transcript_33360/g.66418  ORF Transcript_33360/g.66418 Transcript_33360/m.66418 type:complete len:99 (-) Transcript_33360:39-335(-)